MARKRAVSEKSAIALVGDYPPRCCGIATFTRDVCEAIALQGRERCDVFAVAVSDVPEGYPYPGRVRFEVRQAVQADYRLAADFLNIQQVWAVCTQHEYGIYGGACGSHVLALLRRIRRPLVTTLHTVLKEPTNQQQVVLQEVGRLSDRIVVMSDIAHAILREVYDVPAEKIVTIPHGIPDMPFVDTSFFKDQFGVEGRKVLMTFGLLSPGKGLEYAIEAMPHVVGKHPDAVYIVLGATHPHIKRESGEEYRNSLQRRVHELGLTDNVVFVNRFVELAELCEYLGAADIYLTPYLNEAQVTSGTLAYALGAGKAVVSTPYWHATEMLADGRGRIVPFRDAEAIAREILYLLDDETQRNAIRKRAYNYCRKMVWKRVAQDYLKLFAQASEAWVEKRHRPAGQAVAAAADVQAAEQEVPSAKPKPDVPDELLEVDLKHLKILTDDVGILQHCLYSTPDRSHGYRTDDNARALILSAMHWDQNRDENVLAMMQTYLSFLNHALDEKTGRFRGQMNYDRTWSEQPGSEKSHARALWALGMGVALCPHESMIALATHLFRQGLTATEDFSSPRSVALAIIGIHAYLRRFGGDTEVRRHRKALTERLAGLFTSRMEPDWPWCEDAVTYTSARLPQALLMSGKWMQRGDLIDLGRLVLDWLIRIQTNADGMLSVIGTDGYYPRGGSKAPYDQLPLEAHSLVDACIEAYHVTREKRWIAEAKKAFNWFLGDNDLRIPLYDFTTGGCRDGLHADRVNDNQGAESTLAWLMSLLLMHDFQMEQTLAQAAADKKTKERPVPKAIRPTGPVVGAKVGKHASANRDDK